MNFADYKSIIIPEGEVTKITAGGVVLWQAETGGLPSDYQQVEWIKVDKNIGAYIDLGFSFDTAAKINIGMYSFGSQAYLFGASENSGKYRCMLTTPTGVNAGYGYGYGSNGSAFYAIKIDIQDGYNELEYRLKPGASYVSNKTLSQTINYYAQVSYSMSAPLLLFAQHYNGSPRVAGVRQVYYFEYYDKNDTLICSLIPCYRKSDGVIGMYDTVRKQFLTNAGSGNFIALRKFTGENLVPQSVESDGITIYNGGLGYKDGYRVRSGGAEAEVANGVCTGYIPYVKGDKLYIYPPFTGLNTINAINFYDRAFACIGQVTDSGGCYGICNPNASPFKTQVINGVSVLDLSNNTVAGVENIAFVRITNNIGDTGHIITSGADMTITKNEEITA